MRRLSWLPGEAHTRTDPVSMIPRCVRLRGIIGCFGDHSWFSTYSRGTSTPEIGYTEAPQPREPEL